MQIHTSQELGESIVRTIILEVGLEKFSIMLNNIFMHGEILKERTGFDCSEKELEQIYEAIEILCKVGEQLE
jgi:hypothetical protein